MSHPSLPIRKPLVERMGELFELGVPRDSVTPENLRRIRVVCIATIALCLIGAPSVLQFWWIGLPWISLATILTMAAGSANLVLLRTTLRANLCGHIGLGVFAALLLLTVSATGGFYDPNFAWLYLIPLGAAVLVTTRGAVAWTAATLALIGGFWAAHELGFDLQNRVPEELRSANGLYTRLAAVVSLCLVTASFVVSQRSAERQLGRANHDLLVEGAYVQLLMHAAVSANQASSFDEAMQASVERICSTMGWVGGHVCHVHEDGTIASSGYFHVADAGRYERLRQLTVSASYRAGQGLPGRAVASGKPQCVTNLHSGGLHERAAVAHAVGIEAACAVPVIANGEVRAVLEFASADRLPYVERLLEVFGHIGEQLGRVAERTELQEHLRHVQKMEAVGQLAAGLAHEINNPMSYVSSNLRVLEEEWGDLGKRDAASSDRETTRRLAECGELISESLEGVQRTIAIVRDVQEFSHSGGSDRESWRPVSLSELLEGALRVASARAPAGIRFGQDWGEIPDCLGSSSQIGQVFVNLVVNAIQAVGDAGCIRLSTALDGREVVARVEDDGPGMSTRTRERLFDPFFTTKPVGEGTGLGLSVSYEIVRSHGGEIRVGSEEGEGATFEVRLPVLIGT